MSKLDKNLIVDLKSIGKLVFKKEYNGIVAEVILILNPKDNTKFKVKIKTDYKYEYLNTEIEFMSVFTYDYIKAILLTLDDIADFIKDNEL